MFTRRLNPQGVSYQLINKLRICRIPWGRSTIWNYNNQHQKLPVSAPTDTLQFTPSRRASLRCNL